MLRDMPWRVLALVAVTLLVGATFCVLDADDGTAPDLCSLVLLPVAGLVLGAPRPLVGRVVPIPIRIHPGDPPDRPFPPPRS